MKFGAFLEHLETAHAGRFDRVASGHYAGVRRDIQTGMAALHTTADAVKDQTYFLAYLNQVRVVSDLNQVRDSAQETALCRSSIIDVCV